MVKNSAILIKGAQLLDARKKRMVRADVLIENGIIATVAPNIQLKGDCRVIDAAGAYVMPSMFDCAFQLPKNQMLENLDQCLKKSGIRAVCIDFLVSDFLNHSDNLSKQSEKFYTVYPVLPLGHAQKMAAILSLKAKGAKIFSNEGAQHLGLHEMINVFRYLLGAKVPVVIDVRHHAKAADALHAGAVSYWMGEKGSPDIEESIWVAYYIELCYLTNLPIHFRCLTAARSFELIEKAKSDGLPVSCDVSVLHLLFCDQNTENFDYMFRFQPPLRSVHDRNVLREAINSGVVDCVSSLNGVSSCFGNLSSRAHCWKTAHDFWPVLYHLHQAYNIDLLKAVQLVTQPTPVFSNIITAPSMQVGHPADLLVWKPSSKGKKLFHGLGPVCENYPQLMWTVSGTSVLEGGPCD